MNTTLVTVQCSRCNVYLITLRFRSLLCSRTEKGSDCVLIRTALCSDNSLRVGRSGDRSPTRFSSPFHSNSGAHPAFCTMGNWCLSWVKAAGLSRLPPTPPMAEVKGRVELKLHSPSGPSWE